MRVCGKEAPTVMQSDQCLATLRASSGKAIDAKTFNFLQKCDGMRAGHAGQHSLFEKSNLPSKRYFVVESDTRSYRNIASQI